MRKVKYNGVRPLGTIKPRRMWAPGDVLEVEDDVAEELINTPGFTLVEEKRKRKKEE